MNFLSLDFNLIHLGQRALHGALLLFVAAGISRLEALTTMPSAEGSLSDPNAYTPTTQVAPHDFVHGVLNFDFSNYHLTARGLNLNNKGVVFQSLLRLDWTLYQPPPLPDRTINEVTLTTAMWNEVDSNARGKDKGNWSEIDATIGPNIKFLRDWTLESPFTAFVSETDSFWTCWAWDPRLTYHDHFIKNFSINPYAEFFDELENKVTIVFVRAKSQSSHYGVLGMDPTYVFQDIPLKLELPTYFTIPGENFYQREDGSGGGTGLGLFSTTLKATAPLNFVPPAYGKWSVYAAVQYDYLNNPGLLDGNEYKGAALSRDRNIVVLHAGLTFRF